MNHTITQNALAENFFKTLFLYQMQDFLKCVQACTPAPVLTVKSESEPKPINKKCGARELAWQEEEDSILQAHVKLHGPKHWSKIAHKINYQVFSGNLLRKGKHCRERWYNHLDPGLNRSEWTEKEDFELVELQKKFRNGWSHIAKCLPGRTENSVRNRWNSLNKRNLKDKQKNV